jgi:holo-[acyl-carrier protein] synthase
MLGIDIIEIARVKQAVDAVHGPRFIEKVFTSKEQAYCCTGKVKYNSLAARFAGKEAVAKALGTGFQGIAWKDIEIVNDKSGKPIVVLHNTAQLRAQELAIKEVHISLSHTHTLAFASCYLTK